MQPIFNTSCAGCHSATNQAGGLVLASGLAYGDLVNVAATECAGGATPIDYVSPNSPTTSYLIDKLNGTNLTNCPTYNTLPSLQMPRNGPPYLTAAQIQTISDWISAGAPNN